MRILNIGCGYNPIKDAINTDLVPQLDGVKKFDFTKLPYDYPNNHFDKVYMIQVLSFACPLQFVGIMEELHRILKPEGTLVIEHRNRDDPFTRTKLSKNSFQYFDGRFYANHTTASFKVQKYKKKRLWHLRKIHIPTHHWELNKK